MIAIMNYRTDGVSATPNRQTIATTSFVSSTMNFVQRSALMYVKTNLCNHLCVYSHVKKPVVDQDPTAITFQLQIFNVSDFLVRHVHRQAVMIDIESITLPELESLNHFPSQSNH